MFWHHSILVWIVYNSNNGFNLRCTRVRFYLNKKGMALRHIHFHVLYKMFLSVEFLISDVEVTCALSAFCSCRASDLLKPILQTIGVFVHVRYPFKQMQNLLPLVYWLLAWWQLHYVGRIRETQKLFTCNMSVFATIL